LIKPHADYSVDILKARLLRPVFGESYQLLRVNHTKVLVAIRVSNAPDQSFKVVLRDGFRLRGAPGHLSFWGPTPV